MKSIASFLQEVAQSWRPFPEPSPFLTQCRALAVEQSGGQRKVKAPNAYGVPPVLPGRPQKFDSPGGGISCSPKGSVKTPHLARSARHPLPWECV